MANKCLFNKQYPEVQILSPRPNNPEARLENHNLCLPAAQHRCYKHRSILNLQVKMGASAIWQKLKHP
ncbi:hypothetical protein ABO04_04250 [Nitrosomonas sp. HPC101]|nr:hypothetical protein [Nitrosomonas sp. HPC101]